MKFIIKEFTEINKTLVKSLTVLRKIKMKEFICLEDC